MDQKKNLRVLETISAVRTNSQKQEQARLLFCRDERFDKAEEILGLIRKHIPKHRLPEVELFIFSDSSTMMNVLRHDYSRTTLRKHMPAEFWDEIEDYIDHGICSERIRAALKEAEKEGWISGVGMIPDILRPDIWY